MIPWEIATTFCFAAVMLAIAPGPDNIFVLTQSALYGARAGIATTLGLMTGIIGHTVAVALGVAVIFQTSPMAFLALKMVGAGYLLYLAWLTIKSGATEASLQGQNFVGHWALYKRGIIMNITNPKVTLFFLALLPQFASPEYGSLPVQMFMLGGLFILSAFSVFSTVALLGGQLARWFNASPVAQIYMNRVAAAVFVCMAGALLLSQA